MSFGPNNAPIYFLYLMNSVFMSKLDKFVVVFINDILVYSKDKEEHEQHPRIILQQFCEQQLYVKFSKFAFWLKEVPFLDMLLQKRVLQLTPARSKRYSNESLQDR
jgi:hypothetical protein